MNKYGFLGGVVLLFLMIFFPFIIEYNNQFSKISTIDNGNMVMTLGTMRSDPYSEKGDGVKYLGEQKGYRAADFIAQVMADLQEDVVKHETDGAGASSYTYKVIWGLWDSEGNEISDTTVQNILDGNNDKNPTISKAQYTVNKYRVTQLDKENKTIKDGAEPVGSTTYSWDIYMDSSVAKSRPMVEREIRTHYSTSSTGNGAKVTAREIDYDGDGRANQNEPGTDPLRNDNCSNPWSISCVHDDKNSSGEVLTPAYGSDAKVDFPEIGGGSREYDETKVGETGRFEYVTINGKEQWKWVKLDGTYAKSEWVYDEARQAWFYMESNGLTAVNRYIDVTLSNGQKVTYYLNKNGYIAKNSWLGENGKWVYFGNDGQKYQNKWLFAPTTNPAGWYYFGKDGNMVTSNWIGAYYIKANGVMARNEQIAVSGTIYTFDSEGLIVRK